MSLAIHDIECMVHLNLIYRQDHASHLRKGRRVLEGVASKTSTQPGYEGSHNAQNQIWYTQN